MSHVHAGTCPECGRDLYLIVWRSDQPGSLGTFDFYHLEEGCRLAPIEQALRVGRESLPATA
jgi:hypothetical protein